ncbi:pyridoxal-5'-phosphate-dependent protein [Magnetospirillum sp. ME-1]|uniref:aminotransferase class I/II-fold pyridoxal phosphate-dependent enzyme n=1 Tax=Magnetospirillum sp. ME-1 TaxID=1639348 RepID=UPI000A17CD1D|nr:aminotransferase class I/II-fold pyridoxal phosphate-dependent enzyme [Magnetospirillum sp. ME-1]ARJ66544.1 pyridoxal-5'-phosphate-dependent protein [Magnetospirillum sp. ME-1]
MIPLCTPSLDGNEARYLQECISTTFVSSVGPFVDRLEAMVSTATGACGAVATSSGTTGLHVALTAIGVGPGDLVIMPTYTFIASANAISHCGAQPWLMDITANSWTLDPALLERELASATRRDGGRLIHTASGRRVAAILPVYTLGQPADMDTICAIARVYDLKVVADAAAALGATYKDRPLAQCGADLSVISFNGNKTVTAGGGGAVIGNDSDLVKRVRHLTTTARIGGDYLHDQVGFNYRLTNINAAVGCAQLERLDDLVAAKRRIRSRYNGALGSLPGVSPFPRPDWSNGADWFSGIVLAPPALTTDQARERIRAAGIEARPFWRPMHHQPPYEHCLATAMPVSDDIWPRVLTLPCSTHLSEADQDRVIAAVQEILS